MSLEEHPKSFGTFEKPTPNTSGMRRPPNWSTLSAEADEVLMLLPFLPHEL